MTTVSVLEIIRFKGTWPQAREKFDISISQWFAIKSMSEDLTIKEIEQAIDNIQPWMLSSDIEEILKREKPLLY